MTAPVTLTAAASPGRSQTAANAAVAMTTTPGRITKSGTRVTPGSLDPVRYDRRVDVPGSRFEANAAAEARFDAKGRPYDKPAMRF